MALKRTGVELVADGAARFGTDLDRANKSVTDFGRDAEKAGGGVSAFGEIATGALRKVGAVAVEVGIQAAKAITGFVGDSIGVAATFESSLNRFASVAGDAVADAGMSMGDFSDLALEMGAKTQFSAGEAADAMVELAKGGLDPATIAAGGLEGALNLAAAGELDLSEAANITAKQLGVWADTGVTAAQVADRMAQAANASTVDVDELAVGMANVGGVAKIAGLSFDETTQTLALLAPGFSSAADASTSMKTFLSRLIPTTKPATAAMIELGLATKDGASKFYDATGSFIGMEAAAALLQSQTTGLSEEQRLLAFQTIFGADAIRAAAMVAEAGAAGFDAMGTSMNAAGTATEQAAKRNQGFSFAMESLKGSIETVQIVLGTMLLPILTDLVTNYITPAVNGVLTFAQAFGESSDKAGFLVAKINEIIPGFASFVQAVQNAAQWIGDAWESIGVAFEDEGLIGAIGQAIHLVVPKLQEFGGVILAWVGEQAAALGAQLLVWGEAFVAWVAPMIPPAVAALGQLASQVGAWIVQQAPVWLAQLKSWGESFVAWVAPQIPLLLARAGDLAQRFIAWIGEQAAPILAKIKVWGEKLVEWIVPATKDFLSKWPGFFNDFLTWIGNQAGPLLLKLGEWALSFVEWIAPAIPPILLALAGIAAAIVVWVAETAVVLGTKIVTEWAPAIYTWITEEAIPRLRTALEDIGTEIGIYIRTAAGVIATEALEIGSSLVQGIQDGVSNAWASFTSFIDTQIAKIPKAIRDFLGIGSPSKVMAKEVGEPIAEGIQMGIDKKMPLVKKALLGHIDSLAPDVPKKAAMLGKATGDALGNGVIDATGEKLKIVKQRLIRDLGDPQFLADAGEKARNLGALLEKQVIKGLNEQAEEFRRSLVNLGDPELIDRTAEKGRAIGKAFVDAMAAGARENANAFIGAIADIPRGSGPAFGSGTPQAGGAQANPPQEPGRFGVRVSPPASPGQQAQAASYSTMSTVQYNWSPTYNNANRSPSQDYYLQRALAR